MSMRLLFLCFALSFMPLSAQASDDLSLLEYKALAEKSRATAEMSMTLAHYYAVRYNQGGEGQELYKKAANMHLNKAEKAKKIYGFASEGYNRKLRILTSYIRQ